MNGQSVYLNGDTLYSNLAKNEVGMLKALTVSQLSDLNSVKALVLSGYISQADEDFVHSLGKEYNLSYLDMTYLHSMMSYQGLEGCVKLQKVKFSKYWTKSGQLLFEDCANLSEVVFPNEGECSLTDMSSGTFRGCTSLQTIEIPKTVVNLEQQLFYLCPNLREIHCLSGKTPWATADAFCETYDNVTIYVPKGAERNYRTSAGWCIFKNIKEEPGQNYSNEDFISNSLFLSNDTLFCNLAENEVGSLRASTLHILDDISSIKSVILSGYVNTDDVSFLHSLSYAYNVSSLNMTNLLSPLRDYGFQGCTKLQEVIYSKNWTSTGRYLFRDCNNLHSVIFPTDNKMTSFTTGTFRGCNSLKDIIVPSGVTSIGSQCFYLCQNLKTIILKTSNPPSASEDSFGGQFCTAKLIIPKGTKVSYQTSAGWCLFQTIEENEESASDSDKQLSNNVKFENGTLHTNLPEEEIGRLKSTVLSLNIDLNSVSSVVVNGYLNSDDINFLNALSTVYNLTSIDFTELKSMGSDFGFQGCIKLSKVKFSKYWNTSGWYLFEDCSNLQDVIFPQDNQISTFPSGTFRGCASLENIQVPAKVTSIGAQCFYLCHKLKTVSFLGNKIKSIDKGAFERCSSLETLVLPNGMSLIGERCFEGCPNLREIHSEALTPPNVSESSFDDIYDKATLFVPAGCKSAYMAAPVWKKFSNIQEADATKISNTNVDTVNSDIEIYDINGMRIYKGEEIDFIKHNPPKGVYVIKTQRAYKKLLIK